jgi:hypothetical protein
MDPFQFTSFILLLNFIIGIYSCTIGLFSIFYGCTIEKVDSNKPKEVPNLSRV